MPSASQTSQQSLTMSQQSQQGRSASFSRSFNGAIDGPQIYSASYSGVDVYEMEVNNVAVMRRRHDSWLNATQILKVAGVDKGKRTKILEKEIQIGEHEKVQGGYGKYQGTWIQFERGVEVCRQYGVEDLLRPLLTYDMGQDGGIAGRGDFNTPTKEQAMAAQRKRLYNNAGAEGRPNGLSGTFFKNISSTASHAVAAISKARFGSPGPRNRNGPTRAPSFSRQPSMQNADEFPGNSQQSLASDYAPSTEPPFSQSSVTNANPNANSNANANPNPNQNEPEPPRKRQRVTMTPVDSFSGLSQNMEVYASTFPGSPTEPNESFLYAQSQATDRPSKEEGGGGGGPTFLPLPYEVSPDVELKRSMLMGLFIDSAAEDPANNEMLRTFTPLELDMPIDPQSHTALHWAATLARMPLLRALIAAGASPQRVNASGETALMRACLVTNSMDQGSFPDLLEVLGGTIEARDQKGRTVLHHIAVTSAVKGRNTASRYYLESLLEWVVRQGVVPNSSQATVTATPMPKMGIARFMSEIVNAQDSSGDTALNIAARIGNRSIISQLLEVGADPNISNRVGLRPVDFGIGGENTEGKPSGGADVERSNGNGGPGSNQRSRESSDEIIASITHLLTETGTAFQQEMKAKQSSIDSLHANLRTTSSQLGEARRSIETLTATVKKQQLARQKVANLSHARENDQMRVMTEHSAASQANPSSSSSWETELALLLKTADADAANDSAPDSSMKLLPPSRILRARIRALEERRDATRGMVQALKGRSREVEIKYRRIVALCTRIPEGDVDAVIDGLVKAVESEEDELEIGRVRRFLGGVEGVVR